MKPALTSERLDRGVDMAAKAFEVPHREILSKMRTPAVTRARLALYAAVYDACQTSYTEVAWRMGRDHSTIIWGVKQARAMAAADPEYAVALARVRDVVRYGY